MSHGWAPTVSHVVNHVVSQVPWHFETERVNLPRCQLQALHRGRQHLPDRHLAWCSERGTKSSSARAVHSSDETSGAYRLFHSWVAPHNHCFWMFLVIQFGCVNWKCGRLESWSSAESIGPGHGELAALLSRHHARGLTGTRFTRFDPAGRTEEWNKSCFFMDTGNRIRRTSSNSSLHLIRNQKAVNCWLMPLMLLQTFLGPDDHLSDRLTTQVYQLWGERTWTTTGALQCACARGCSLLPINETNVKRVKRCNQPLSLPLGFGFGSEGLLQIPGFKSCCAHVSVCTVYLPSHHHPQQR